MDRHIIKYEYNDGVKLNIPETWCGSTNRSFFQDIQHAALSIEQGSSVIPCKNCLRKGIKYLEEGL